MRIARLGIVVIVGCGGGGERAVDAAIDGADPDAAIDAPDCPVTLLAGGSDVTAQGWTVVMQAPATLTYGADYTRLQTSTNGGATTGGQLLLSLDGAVAPFQLEVVMMVEAVHAHDPLDSAATIMGSFTPPFGLTAERAEMIYADADRVGWGDNAASFPAPLTDGAYHTYILSVAGGAAQLTLDGTPALTRNAFTSSGTIAIGDQTNEPNVDSTLRLRSVRRLCSD